MYNKRRCRWVFAFEVRVDKRSWQSYFKNIPEKVIFADIIFKEIFVKFSVCIVYQDISFLGKKRFVYSNFIIFEL